MTGKTVVIRGDTRNLPLPDGSVDLICTSPPYWSQRSYTDAGVHYDEQLGSESTPAKYIANLIGCTAEWARVLKPGGSMFVNLGDKYSTGNSGESGMAKLGEKWSGGGHSDAKAKIRSAPVEGLPPKTLLGLPWRYAIACMDELGLILRRDIIWSKKNGIPESVKDRARSAHEYLFHLVKQPQYYSAVDEIREDHDPASIARFAPGQKQAGLSRRSDYGGQPAHTFGLENSLHPLGRLPGSVWEFPLQPLIGPKCRLVWDGRTVRWFSTWAEGEKHMRMLAREWWAWPPGSGRPSLRPETEHFACVDAETEILTKRGWLRHDQLTEGDQVAGYDLLSDTARWTGCSAVHRYNYDDDLIAVESRDISMRLTPNHRTIVQHANWLTKRRDPVHVIRADQLGRDHFIPRSATWQSSGDFRVGERAAAMMGWVAAEGWYQGPSVWLSQSLDANAPYVAEIDGLIPDAEIRTARKRTYRGRPYTEVNWKLSQPTAELIQREMPYKLLPWWLATASEQERRAALDAFIAGDGHRRPDGRIGIYQKKRHNLDVLQAVAVTLGYKTTLRQGGGRFALYLTEGGRSITLRGTSGAGSKVSREHYKGIVWCPSTGTGTFIARRNGSVFITGNSFPMELPRRVIKGWSPDGICIVCGQGRRPVSVVTGKLASGFDTRIVPMSRDGVHGHDGRGGQKILTSRGITGYVCDCTPYTDHPATARGVTKAAPGSTGVDPREAWSGVPVGERERVGPWREYHTAGWDAPPTRPAVVLDPFGGTGCTAMVAAANGRVGISVDYSHSYSRFARWRVTDPYQRSKALEVKKPPPRPPESQMALFEEGEVGG